MEEFGENLLKIVAFLLSQGVKKEALVLVGRQIWHVMIRKCWSRFLLPLFCQRFGLRT